VVATVNHYVTKATTDALYYIPKRSRYQPHSGNRNRTSWPGSAWNGTVTHWKPFAPTVENWRVCEHAGLVLGSTLCRKQTLQQHFLSSPSRISAQLHSYKYRSSVDWKAINTSTHLHLQVKDQHIDHEYKALIPLISDYVWQKHCPARTNLTQTYIIWFGNLSQSICPFDNFNMSRWFVLGVGGKSIR